MSGGKKRSGGVTPAESLLGGKVTLHPGNCLDVLDRLPESHFDSALTDPPYHLQSIVKRFGGPDAAPASFGKESGAYKRHSRGFMGKRWDGGDVAFRVETWAKVFRVMKPGAHLLAFGATRNYHRMACAIEDAGFEIRDMMQWLYGSGFPKSHNVAGGIDRRKDWHSLARLGAAIKTARTRLGLSQTEAARRVGLIDGAATLGGGGYMWFETGRLPTREEWTKIKSALGLANEFDASFEAAEREVIAKHRGTSPGTNMRNGLGGQQDKNVGDITRSLSELARKWEGWGTALKPANEPVCLARKPLSEKSIAANVIRWRTGALNIDGCRIGAGELIQAQGGISHNRNVYGENFGKAYEGAGREYQTSGRWPANVLHDGSAEVLAGLPDSVARPVQPQNLKKSGSGESKGNYDEETSAGRFFYTAKADTDERAGSDHPTVKPLDLLQYLARLITPPGGSVLDPFAGTGTTGEAAWREGLHATLIEADPASCEDIRRRCVLALAGPVERSNAITKARGKLEDTGGLPLFGPQVT